MCGIVGAVAQRNIVPILLEGLKRLEYRGYDSCGVAVNNGGLKRARSVARVAELQEQVASTGLQGNTGIAHTRWATHGAPATNNAHPHFSPGTAERIGLVHNGIIENYEEIRAELKALGYVFESQTDTEVIAHLVNHMYDGDLLRTVQKVVKRLHGAYAIAVFCQGRAAAHRRRPPRLPADRRPGRRREFPRLRRDGAGRQHRPDHLSGRRRRGRRAAGRRADLRQLDRTVERHAQTVQAYSGAIELGPYRHYMQKEIFEQPRAIADTLEGVMGFTPELFGAESRSGVQRYRQRADPGLRHQLLLRHDRALLAGVARRPADQRRDRQRIPLPQAVPSTRTRWSW